jgi:hypothetical protein
MARNKKDACLAQEERTESARQEIHQNRIEWCVATPKAVMLKAKRAGSGFEEQSPPVIKNVMRPTTISHPANACDKVIEVNHLTVCDMTNCANR